MEGRKGNAQMGRRRKGEIIIHQVEEAVELNKLDDSSEQYAFQATCLPI